jgi:hypothetical protein
MGSRTGGSFSEWAGTTGGGLSASGWTLGTVAREISSNAPAQIVVGTAIGVLSASVPVIGTAAVAYQAGKMVYKAAQAGDSSYRRTGDPDWALRAVARSLTSSAAEAVVGEGIDTAVDTGWILAKAALGAKTGVAADKIITSAAAATIQQEASKWKRRKRHA